ncbi:glycosyltransferase family 2 protein [Hyphococcus formosus]|uniref:glycosyltransferase family 2 protein n=1 Tax=Hyphococcus formosus TaxID=3143534 RepID=UPI00398B87C2
MKSVCVIILNYGTPDLTIASAQSVIDEITALGGELVIVDNCSPDDSAKRLRLWVDNQPETYAINLVLSPVNGGYAAGNNLGLNAGDAEFYVLLNSDTVVRSGAISALLSVMRDNPKIGLAGPRMLDENGQPAISRFRHPKPLSEFVEATGADIFYRKFRHAVVPVMDDEADDQIEWLGFPCIMLRGAMIDEIGPLDERYFMYFEDTAYCRKAANAGWQLKYCRDAAVEHFCGKSSQIEDNAAAFRRLPSYYYASRTRYFKSHYGTAGYIRANLLWYLGRLVNFARIFALSPPKKTCAKRALDIWTAQDIPHP